MNFDYDIVLSFAGEDRIYVEKVAEVLTEIGVKVFYDYYEQANLWGKDLYTYLDDVYTNKAKYCIMFISKHYKEKLWTNHERGSAQARAFSQFNSEYILPVRFDDTEIPGIRITTGYLDGNRFRPDELAYMVAKKLNPDFDVSLMLAYLRKSLPNYSITIEGTKIIFNSEMEGFYREFSLRLLLEMYRIGEIDNMFILPAIVPN